MITLYSECHIIIVELISITGIIGKNQSEKGLTTSIKFTELKTKVEIELQIEEGKLGILTTYIFNLNSNVSNVYIQPIRLLCNYQKMPTTTKLPTMSEMQVKGMFTKTDMHMWLLNAIPDTSERCDDESEKEEYVYCSPFTNTYIQCLFTKNSATISSDNLPSLVALQKYLIAESYCTKKVNLSVQVALQEVTLKTEIEYILPKLRSYIDAQRRYELVLPLTEMKSVEGCVLTEKYENILRDEERLKRDALCSELYIKYYENIIGSLYEAKCFTNGKLVNTSLDEFRKVVVKCNEEDILQWIAKISN